MPITHKEFIEFAKSKLDISGDEIEYRTVANRAYYSIFHACRDLADSGRYRLIPPDGSMGSHDALYKSLMDASEGRCGEKYMSLRRIGVMAQRINKPIRRKADYFLGSSFEKSEAADAVAKAELLLNVISQL